MDQLASQLSNVSLYDVKKYVRKAQNAVLNFSEMEAKVREATNNEPWGTPTSTMQLIADATNNYQQFHEIMPFIYRRFTDKSASEWRQIYKSLQLLDYLVRNGSERVVDYARSHVSVVEMLRHFSYIDSRGVDQGASIRKRAEELVGLLGSTEKLRTERKKAKQLHAKTANASYSSGGFGGSGKKYGGISSETFRQQRFGGAPTQQVYGDGGGFDGSNHIVTATSHTQTSLDDDEFEEYEVNTPVTAASSNKTSKKTTSAANTNGNRIAASNLKQNQNQGQAEEEDDDDDEFAEFQTAPTSSHAPSASNTNANILDLFDTPVTTTPASPSSAQPHTHTAMSFQTTPVAASHPAEASSITPSQPSANIDLFDSLWESGKTTIAAKPALKSTASSSGTSASKTHTGQPSTNQSTTTEPATGQSPAPQTSSEPVDLLSF